jgi:hypothetical protein
MADMLAARFARSSLPLLIALTPAVALAQGRMGGGGRGRGGRGVGNPAREEGFAVQRPVNPVNLLIEHRQELTLTDTQFVRVIAIKRALDSTNAPLMRRIDSVQRLFKGGKPIFSDPSPARRDSLAEGKSAVQEMLVGVRENISDGREKAFALLSGQQAAKAQEIEAKAAKALEDEEQQARGRGKP